MRWDSLDQKQRESRKQSYFHQGKLDFFNEDWRVLLFYCEAFGIPPHSAQVDDLTAEEVWGFWYAKQIEGKLIQHDLQATAVPGMTLRYLEGQMSELAEFFLLVSEDSAFKGKPHEELVAEAKRRMKKAGVGNG